MRYKTEKTIIDILKLIPTKKKKKKNPYNIINKIKAYTKHSKIFKHMIVFLRLLSLIYFYLTFKYSNNLFQYLIFRLIF